VGINQHPPIFDLDPQKILRSNATQNILVHRKGICWRFILARFLDNGNQLLQGLTQFFVI